MDPLEKGWEKDKLDWVKEKMLSSKYGVNWFKLPSFCNNKNNLCFPRQGSNEDKIRQFWTYFYGTIYDMGESYK